MVVIDYLDGYRRLTWWVYKKKRFASRGQNSSAERSAREAWQSSGIVARVFENVHGDFRKTNIIVSLNRKDVKVVDFDWCARESEGRYPMFLNNEIWKWHNDVWAASEMKREHDTRLLQQHVGAFQ